MAEVVHRSLEAMLPQLEELESSGIFSHVEIRALVKCRREHEYRLVRRPTRKEDFLAAIKYEVNLDLLRKKRKKRLRITGTGQDADYGIQNRINHLFSRAVKKFKGDLKLWLQYIEFAQQNKRKISLGQIFGKALALHPSSTNLWVMAAKFHFEDLNDASSARSLLQQGLRVNSSSQDLWIECFRMEMMYADKLRKRRGMLGLENDDVVSATPDEVLSFKLASVVFNQAIKAIPDAIPFRLNFLPVGRQFDDSLAIQQEIYDSLKVDFPVHPLTWDALARKSWLQADFKTLSESEVLALEEQSAEVFAEGIAITEESLDIEGSSGKPLEIWDHYLKWCMERLKDERSTEAMKKKVQNRIKGAFRQASKEGLLAVSTYMQYVELLDFMDAVKEAEEALVAALRAHHSSLQLWLLRLSRYKCLTTARKGAKSLLADLERLFKEALQNIPTTESLPVWELWLSKASSISSSCDDIEKIYKTGIACGSAGVKEALQCHYLNWTMKISGISKARRLYTQITCSPPVAFGVYKKCLDLEKKSISQAGGDVSRLRELYESAIREHGSDHYDLWLEYITMELSQESGGIEKVGRLYWRATKQLQPQYVSSFIEQYSNMQTHG